MKQNNRALPVVLSALILLLPHSAFAYVGPGSGLTAIGAALAFVGAIFFALFGFIWYPFKRLWRAMTAKKGKAKSAAGTADS